MNAAMAGAVQPARCCWDPMLMLPAPRSCWSGWWLRVKLGVGGNGPREPVVVG